MLEQTKAQQGNNRAIGLPASPLDIYSESNVGIGLMSVSHQVNELQMAIQTLYDRLYPVLMPMPASNQGKPIETTSEPRSPIDHDLNVLATRVLQSTGTLHEILHNLTI